METGRIAKQADGACWSARERLWCWSRPSPRDRRRRARVSSRSQLIIVNTATPPGIPGGYFKREGRPTEREILTSRLTDRPIRPLFPTGYQHETQIISMVISADDEHDPDVLAITGASAALYLSDIPFYNPIAGVRVGLVEGKYVVNPTYEQQRNSTST